MSSTAAVEPAQGLARTAHLFQELCNHCRYLRVGRQEVDGAVGGRQCLFGFAGPAQRPCEDVESVGTILHTDRRCDPLGDARLDLGADLRSRETLDVEHRVHQRPSENAVPVDRRMHVIEEHLLAEHGVTGPTHGELTQQRLEIHHLEIIVLRHCGDDRPHLRQRPQRSHVFVAGAHEEPLCLVVLPLSEQGSADQVQSVGMVGIQRLGLHQRAQAGFDVTLEDLAPTALVEVAPTRGELRCQRIIFALERAEVLEVARGLDEDDRCPAAPRKVHGLLQAHLEVRQGVASDLGVTMVGLRTIRALENRCDLGRKLEPWIDRLLLG